MHRKLDRMPAPTGFKAIVGHASLECLNHPLPAYINIRFYHFTTVPVFCKVRNQKPILSFIAVKRVVPQKQEN
jgi:hypothetical protein